MVSTQKESLNSTHPELVKEWHPTLNAGRNPGNYSKGSKERVWWKCSSCGNEWAAIIGNRSRGSGCPECGKKKREKSKLHNKLESGNNFEQWCLLNATIGGRLLKEWDYGKNGNLLPAKITSSNARTKIWWHCENGHIYKASVYDRKKGRGCPFCRNRVIVEGENDFATTHPLLLEEWDYEKNTTISPNNITYGYSKNVFWKCKNGHSWEASPNNRTSGNKGCPYCNHRYVIKGQTSFAAKYKELLSDWDFNKNEIDPEEVFPNCRKVVWWKCQICGNEWEKSISSRSNGSGCPNCAARIKTSFPEQAIFYYIKRQYVDAILHYEDIFDNKMEIDIYVPSLRLGIEYDGCAWHKTKAAEKRERIKYDICKTNGIKLVRIKEEITDGYDNYCDVLIKSDWTTHNVEAINSILDNLTKYIHIDNYDCGQDEMDIRAEYMRFVKVSSLSSKCPEIIEEWDFEKNKKLTPEMFSVSSGQKVWWKCKQGHSWRKEIYVRTQGHGCPYCANKKVLENYNDLSKIAPSIAKEWNYEKNVITPMEILFCSDKRVWWKCSRCSNEWIASVYSRYKLKTGCPVCKNSTAKAGINDFASQYPDLLKEWCFEKNEGVNPADFVPGSTKKVWWKCEKDHTWLAEIRVRVRGNKCPYCQNYYAWPGFNDLQTKNPELICDWDYAKNDILPSEVLPGAKRKVWWKCHICEREWEAYIYSRVAGRGCVGCNKRRNSER